MNQAIDSWLNNTNVNVSHSPFLFGIICGGILGTSLSVTSFISLRRLIIQGVPAGIVSYLGSALAETLFLGLITFGSLRMIDSWIILEPSLKLLITIFCYDTVIGFLLDNRLKIVSFDQKLDLLKIFLCNAIIVVSNPGSSWAASALLTSVESFEFRENTIFLVGIFFGLFFMGLLVGFSVLGLTYLWMARSTKSFRSLIYRFNKIISTLTLTLLLLSTIYYHVDVYIGTSFTTWSNPLIRSPSLKKDTLMPFSYQLFQNDIDATKFLLNHKKKIRQKRSKSPLIKNITKYLNKEKDQSVREKKSLDTTYLLNYEAILEARKTKWFSRSHFYESIKEKTAALLNLKQEKVKFFQDPSFADMSVPYSPETESPLLLEKPSKRIAVRQLTKDEYGQLKKIREKRIQELKKSF